MSDTCEKNNEKTPVVARWRWIAWVVITCLIAVVCVVSYYVGDWPWKFNWFDGDKLDGALLAAAQEARIHLSGIAMVGVLASAWLLLRKRGSLNEVSDELRHTFFVADDPEEIVRKVLTRVTVFGIDVLLEPDDGGGTPNREDVEFSVLNLENENRLLKEQLDNVKKAKPSFLTSISDDLSTSISGVFGASELLGSSSVPQHESGHLKTINASTDVSPHSEGEVLDSSQLSSSGLVLVHSELDSQPHSGSPVPVIIDEDGVCTPAEDDSQDEDADDQSISKAA